MLGIVLAAWVSTLPDFDYKDTVPHSRFPGVVVSDGLEFPIDAHSTKSNWREAKEHVNRLDGYMQTYYYPKAYQLWKQEAEWTRDCWDQLDNFHAARTDHIYAGYRDEDVIRRERKLYALWKLKELLGEEAYNARMMPTPVVTWLK